SQNDLEALPAATTHPWGRKSGSFDRSFRYPHDILVAHHVEGRPVPGASLSVAPVPKDPQYRLRSGRKGRAARNAPGFALVPPARLARGGDHPLTRFGEPLFPIQAPQLRFNNFRQRKKIFGVVDGVLDHLVRKRAQRPVCFLRSLGKLHAKVPGHQRGQTEFPIAAKPRGDHGVENIGGREPASALQHPQIVIRAVQNELSGGESLVERLGGKPDQRVDQDIFLRGADLEEAELLEITVKAVRLGIQGNTRKGSKPCDKFRQALGIGDQGSAINFSRGSSSPPRRARGSRTWVVPSMGAVTDGPPARGAASVKATSATSLGFPSRGKSLRSGKKGYPSHIRIRRRSGWPSNRIPIIS